MSLQEDYLDDLLKSMMSETSDSDQAEDNTEKNGTEAEASTASGYDFAIEDIGEEEPNTESMMEDFPEQAAEEDDISALLEQLNINDSDELSMDDLAISDFGEEELPVEGMDELEEEQEETATPENNDLLMEDFAIEDFGEEELPVESMDELEEEQEETATPEKNDLLMEDFAIEDFGEEEPPVDDGEEYEPNTTVDDINTMSLDEIDAMFAAADAAANEAQAGTNRENTEDDELAEINDLLNTDSDSAMEDDMLALLESMSSDEVSEEIEVQGEESEENREAENIENEDDLDVSIKKDKKNKKDKKKEKPKKKGFFSKKEKKSESNPEEVEVLEEKELDELDGIMEFGEELDEQESTPKKQKFFTKIFSFLTEADEEDEIEAIIEKEGLEPSDENLDILKELDSEDKKKKKAKGKKKKGDKEDSKDSDSDDENEEEESSKKKKGKKKKEKKEKETDEKPVEETKPGKKVSKKNIAVVVGMNITVAAIIIVFCFVVPGYIDKRGARDAYYQADFAKSYELLYGKKLDDSDDIIFNKSKVILQMQRKLDSYHNYLNMGKEIQALDALLLGVEKYPQILIEAEKYNATQEVRTIYETILNILNDKYNISEEVAKSIVAYEDNLVYTRKVESIVTGTPFVMPGEETVGSDTQMAADMLPEEKQMLENSGAAQSNQTDVMSETPVQNQEEVLPVQTQENTAKPEQSQESAPVEESMPGVSIGENGENTAESGGQNGTGQIIQGVPQPIDVTIHGN